MNLEYLFLDDPGWERVLGLLKGKSGSPISDNVILQLKSAGAQSAIIEHGYIDRDFSEMYSNFYSRTFKRHIKICKRVFIFDRKYEDDLISVTSPAQLTYLLEENDSQHILSIITIRPVPEAPINSISSRIAFDPSVVRANILIKSNIETHLSGADIMISANQMTQQDARVGSCAQASIWCVARHFRNRHKGPWVSIPEITDLAISRADFELSRSRPLGSDFLPIGNMVHTLQALGTEPYGYSVEPNGKGGFEWLSVNPEEVISRYLDSGIPLILGLELPGLDIGHAVVATGRVRDDAPQNRAASRRTIAEFYSDFLINDDQIGPNLFMPVNPGGKPAPEGHGHIWNINGTPCALNVKESVKWIIVPLPSKVYFPAEKAENISWTLLNHYVSTYDIHVAENKFDNNKVAAASAKFKDDIRNGQVIARTYLTFGWKYKQRALRNNLEDAVKVLLRDLELPKFVWVTEIGTFESLSSENPLERRIFSHAVFDATAKNTEKESALVFHAPGYCMYHKHMDVGGTSTLKENIILLPESEPYFPKRRGEKDFQAFYDKVAEN